MSDQQRNRLKPPRPHIVPIVMNVQVSSMGLYVQGRLCNDDSLVISASHIRKIPASLFETCRSLVDGVLEYAGRRRTRDFSSSQKAGVDRQCQMSIDEDWMCGGF